MLAASEFLGKLCFGVEARIYGTTKFPLCLLEARSRVRESQLADNHQVDVAIGLFFLASDRAVNQCPLNVVRYGCQCFAKHFHHSERFGQKSLEFSKERRLGVRPIINPISFHARFQHTGTGQRSQFALQTGGSSTQVGRQVAHVPPPLGVHQRRGKHALAYGREQSIKGGGLTHNA